MKTSEDKRLNPLNAELNPICYLLALLGAHHIVNVSSIRVKIIEAGQSYAHRFKKLEKKTSKLQCKSVL